MQDPSKTKHELIEEISFLNQRIEELESSKKDRNQTEEALLMRNNLLSALLNNLQVGVFMVEVPCGKPLLANKTAVNLLGQGILSDATAQNLAVAYKAYKGDSHDLYPAEKMPVLLGMSGEFAHVDDMVVERPDGARTFLEVFGSPVTDDEGNIWASLVSFLDISDRKQAERDLRKAHDELEERVLERTEELRLINEELQKNEESLRSILQTAMDGFWLVDMQARLLAVNETYCRMSGYSEQELLVMHISDLEATETSNDTSGRIKKIMEQGEDRFESIHRRKDGSIFNVEISVQYRPTDGGQFVVFLHDITERNQMMQDLKRASEVTERASRAKSDFLANMSHELRTPLNGIIGFANLLHDGIAGTLDNEQKEYAGLIHSSGKHLLSLINDILDLSKVEAGKMELELSHFPLISQLRNVVSMVQSKALKHGITIDVDVPLNLEIKADERKLRQILFNLLSNAVKFSPDGGKVQVAARVISDVEAGEEIPVEAGRTSPLTGHFCEISVTDTGIGIKDEDLPKLFREFSQIGNVHTKEYEGTGLGLALTKKLVELHGGCIWVKSKFGQGSTFSFTIPLKASSDMPATRDQTEYRTIPGSTSSAISLNILLAEDNIVNQELVKTLLLKRGHRLYIVNDGIEAIDALGRDHYDLIFMDLQMPRQDGYETTRVIRNSGDGKFDPNIPIIAMTAYAMWGDRDKCIQAGMNDYISKPINVEELDRVLHNCITNGGSWNHESSCRR